MTSLFVRACGIGNGIKIETVVVVVCTGSSGGGGGGVSGTVDDCH